MLFLNKTDHLLCVTGVIHFHLVCVMFHHYHVPKEIIFMLPIQFGNYKPYIRTPPYFAHSTESNLIVSNSDVCNQGTRKIWNQLKELKESMSYMMPLLLIYLLYIFKCHVYVCIVLPFVYMFYCMYACVCLCPSSEESGSTDHSEVKHQSINLTLICDIQCHNKLEIITNKQQKQSALAADQLSVNL